MRFINIYMLAGIFLLLSLYSLVVVSSSVLPVTEAPGQFIKNGLDIKPYTNGLVSGPSVPLAKPVTTVAKEQRLQESHIAASDIGLTHAPENPIFTAWKNQKKGSNTEFYGAIPPIFVIPEDARKKTPSTLPSFYDARTRNKVTPVKDQGDCGSCWAFATLGSLEGFFKPNVTYDLSENAINRGHQWSYAPCNGGWWQMAASMLTAWNGPYLESEYPYSPYSSLEGGRGVTHVQDIYLFTQSSAIPDPDIKRYLYTRGPMWTTYGHYNQWYNETNASYYQPKEFFRDMLNHAVTIIGWDDSYSRLNFTNSQGLLPPKDGAWLVKNSWGTQWGQRGYFWISYHDAHVREGFVGFTGETDSRYDRIYQYDQLGWVTSYGFPVSGGHVAWGANRFRSQANGSVAAVGTYFPSTGSKYYLEIWKNVNVSLENPREGLKILNQSGDAHAGYQTIRLKSPVPVNKRDLFSVIIRYDTPGFAYPVPVEAAYSGVSDKAVSSGRGLSYISQDGRIWYDWVNIFDMYISYTDTAIKAYIKD